jgi:hypothetical protein
VFLQHFEPGTLFWDNTVAHEVIQEFFKVEAFKELTKLNFQSFSLLVANSHLEGGIEAKLKIFETLQKNLYDVISGNAAKKYFAAYYTVDKPLEKSENHDLGLLRKVNQF